ncbi:MAG: hypothetical protein COB02_16965 [Candidatus Cloacimonadota bacterium]|nr:MAG: hypothetical protein COB02_16965 [Candidatus Cloacimonadota bacterium]
MSLGKKYESFEPLYKTQLIVSIFFSFLFFTFVLTFGIIGKVIFGLLLAGTLYSVFSALSLKNSRLIFHEKGLQIKMPNSIQFDIQRDMIEDFQWEAEEVTQDDGYSHDTKHKITFLISYETDSGSFEEVNWTEEFAPGSIQRLQRAIDREVEVQDEDDYYDE